MFFQSKKEKTTKRYSTKTVNKIKPIRKSRIPALLFLLSAVLSPLDALAQSILSISAANKTALGIETEAVLSRDSFAQVTATGVVVAPQGSVHPVISPFDGTMLRPLVLAGTSVDVGQPIALLHSPDYSIEKAEQETLRLTLVHNQHLYESAENLHKLGLRSELEVDEARHELDSARLEYRAMEDRLASVADGDRAGQYVLTAPIKGVVSSFSLGQGDEVSASLPLATIFEGSRYWARIEVPETGANKIELNSKVQLAESGSAGTVIAIAPEINPESRSQEIQVELPEDYRWRIGQLVSASFFSNIEPSTQALPEEAIVRIGGDTFVFIEVPSGFRKTQVNIVSRSRGVVIVSGEIGAKDRVAISGLAALKNIIEGA